MYAEINNTEIDLPQIFNFSDVNTMALQIEHFHSISIFATF